MSNFGFQQMQDIQRELQEHYIARWHGLGPQKGKDTLLWMIVEIGEAADILSKSGGEAVMNDAQTRRHFVEELCDVMMYFNDLALCYNITPAEISEIYVQKHLRNMTRWKQDPLPSLEPDAAALRAAAASGRFGFTEMQAIQRQLRERYLDLWGAPEPGQGILTTLRIMIEAGEAADILKKEGGGAVMEDPGTRKDFIEELCDVMMYLNDLMLCYSVAPEKLEKIYFEKHHTNMGRWPTE